MCLLFLLVLVIVIVLAINRRGSVTGGDDKISITITNNRPKDIAESISNAWQNL